MRKGVLLLTLRIFSATGGIEKVCKVACKALSELEDDLAFGKLTVLSMYDKTQDVDEKYLSAANFSGYNQRKFKFTKAAITSGLQSRVVILSHINLLSIGLLIKILSPKTKLVLYAHGIEVWGPLSLARKTMLRRCDLIFSVSQFTRGKMIDQYGLSEDKVVVFNNCIDPYLPPPVTTGKDIALQREYGLTDGHIVLMTLTRLSSKELYKGYDHVLLSLHSLLPDYPNIKYLIVGRYDKEEKKRLDDIIALYHLEKNVVFTGYISDQDMARHYSLADIYVMPSKKEGFGIVFIEAMHYGLPVIAGSKDGSADALYNGKLGLLVNPDSQQEINDAVKEVIEHREKYLPDKKLLTECFSYSTYKSKFSQLMQSVFSLVMVCVST